MKYVAVFAIILSLLSCNKPEFTNLSDTDIPFPAPTNLSIIATSVTSCVLNWQDNSTGEHGFIIDRKKDNEEWIIVYQSVGENVEYLIESGLIANATYQYRVYGFVDENNSTSISCELNLTIPVPTDLIITQTSLTSCELKWNYSGFGEGFKLERRLSGSSWQNIAELPLSETTIFQDLGLFEGETYYYRVYVYDSTHNGDVLSESIELLYEITDIDGNVYKVVHIGNQYWMEENLKVTHYRNGDDIAYIFDSDDWTNTNSGAYCNYGNMYPNIEIYGNLYNWYAVGDSRELAPEGWHVPSDAEIIELEMYLGMSESEANSTNWRGTNEGSKLAGNTDLWCGGVLINNAEFGTSGFSFLPGGSRDNYGTYYNISFYGNFWSSTEYNGTNAWNRLLHYGNTDIARAAIIKHYGFSVRCVRD